jgi:hypothetical protein
MTPCAVRTTQIADPANWRADDDAVRLPEQAEALTRLDRIGLLTLLVAFVVFIHHYSKSESVISSRSKTS